MMPMEITTNLVNELHGCSSKTNMTQICVNQSCTNQLNDIKMYNLNNKINYNSHFTYSNFNKIKISIVQIRRLLTV